MKEVKKKSSGRPKGTTRKKFNKVEMMEFLNECIEKVFTEHLSWTEFNNWVIKKHKVSVNQANEYWKRVFEVVKEKYKLDRENEIDKHVYHFWSLYDGAVDKKDYNTARQILVDLTKLKGLNEAEKVDLTTHQEIIFKFGNEE